MPTREELFAAYALDDRETARVRMNFVSSLDGAVTLGGKSGPLGGETDRELMQVLRALADVVLVGAGTVGIEGYGGVKVREEDAAWRASQGLPSQPRFGVVSRELSIEPDDPFLRDAERHPLVITCQAAPWDRRQALQGVAEVIVCGPSFVDLPFAMRVLASRGLNQVLCEGGPHLFGSLVAADLVDEVCLTIAPRLVGGGAGRIDVGAPEADRRMRLAHTLTDDEGFVFLRYARA